jgi:hypothetical protein
LVRVNAENSIRDLKADLFSVLDLYDNLLLIFDLEQNILHANSWTLNHLGISMDILKHKKMQDIFTDVETKNVLSGLFSTNEGENIKLDIPLENNNRSSMNVTAIIKKGKYEGRDVYFVLGKKFLAAQ